MNRFENKVVLIIGATGGIGEEICRRLSAEKASLVLFSKNLSKLEELKSRLDTESIIVHGDAQNIADLEIAVEKGKNAFGKIDSLIHAVGSIVLKPIHNTDVETFRNILELNLISPFLAVKSVIQTMMNQKSGNIVVLSSVAGSKGIMNHEAISAAKGGLESMIRSSFLLHLIFS